MEKVIIGIHGMANKTAPENLSRWWRAALEEGLDRYGFHGGAGGFEFELVYWAGHLYKYPLHEDADYVFDQLYNREPYLPADGSGGGFFEGTVVDALRSKVREHAGWLLEVASDYVDLEAVGDAVIKSQHRDLAFYYDPGQQVKGAGGYPAPVREVLRDALHRRLLAHAGKEILLVAHSMGSIIAYDLLTRLGREGDEQPFDVTAFVTIGSPLGMRIVQSKIVQEAVDNLELAELAVPGILAGRWVNLADPRDPVCFQPRLGADFVPNRFGVGVEDYTVRNDYAGPGGVANPHKAYGYLRTHEMAELADRWLMG